MEKIQIDYTNFEQKGKYFFSGDKIVWENVDNLFKLLKQEYESQNNPFVYRGLSEARYFIFNSSQRDYIKKGQYVNIKESDFFSHYENYVIDNINKLKKWNNRVIEKLLHASEIKENNTLAYLSFMQHYGIPTPLIDFTRNPFIALYFAISSHDGTVKNDFNNPLNDFISIYKVYKPTIIHEMFHGIYVQMGFDMNRIPYNELSNSIGLYLVSNENGELKLNNNANIINQEGLFYYNHHPFCPLEVKYKMIVDDIKNEVKINPRAKNQIPEKIGYCLNIYKKIIPEIRAKLNDMGINEEYLFPDLKKINN